MNFRAALFALCAFQTARLHGGEALLTRNYQPLDGLGTAEIEILPVICHDTYGTSGYPNEIALIAAKNIPPTNATEPLDDHNVASLAGIKITIGEDAQDRFVITLDLSQTKVTDDFIATEPEVVGATLECIRRTAGSRLAKMTLEAKFKPEGQEETRKVFERFQKHRKDKPFVWRKPEEGSR